MEEKKNERRSDAQGKSLLLSPRHLHILRAPPARPALAPAPTGAGVELTAEEGVLSRAETTGEVLYGTGEVGFDALGEGGDECGCASESGRFFYAGGVGGVRGGAHCDVLADLFEDIVNEGEARCGYKAQNLLKEESLKSPGTVPQRIDANS